MAMEPGTEHTPTTGRVCARCATVMQAVELRSGRVWRCPSCHQLEI